MSDLTAERNLVGHSVPAVKARVEQAVDVALREFARNGYAATRLETIATEAGVTKRMLHYHFGDKKGLYISALQRAAWSFSPPQEFLERTFTVPIEGIRRFVDAIFHQMVQHPDSIQLFLRENLDPVLDKSDVTAVWSDMDMILQIERLLMMGQDAGAFRPGVSASDLGFIIASTAFFRVGNKDTMDSFGAINLFTPDNTEGMRRLTIDLVLSFLTSTIPDTGHNSYLTVSLPRDMQAGSSDSEQGDDALPVDYSVGESADDIYDNGSGAGTL